jgi:hypothetical protein
LETLRNLALHLVSVDSCFKDVDFWYPPPNINTGSGMITARACTGWQFLAWLWWQYAISQSTCGCWSWLTIFAYLTRECPYIARIVAVRPQAFGRRPIARASLCKLSESGTQNSRKFYRPSFPESIHLQITSIIFILMNWEEIRTRPQTWHVWTARQTHRHLYVTCCETELVPRSQHS